MPSLTVETRGDREIVFTRMFKAPRQLVWDAHTKPELVRQWMSGPYGWSMTECDIDLRVGGRFRYDWTHEDGRTMGVSGGFQALEPPARMVHTELFDEDWTGGEAVNTTVFEQRDTGTLMTLSVLYASPEGRAAALQTGMTEGMEQTYALMDALLARGATA